MGRQWNNGIFGCLNNCTLCLVTWFVPCYTFGMVAEKVGENCLICGLSLMVPILHLYTMSLIRGRVREQQDIEGTFVEDCLWTWFLPLCAIAQMAQEVGFMSPGGDGMARQ
ncbi:uncharacterized protein LOC135806296 [Sycon ciliatum]|uniref:uncharacterized protein LOC135806296 n=1 Tax=Sycon ciliatum TaxID=27933 RepID=UPI0020ACA0BB|eukprot:scpid76375/ scgid15558/ Protein PLANT CADMIUM RESISTANCE 3